MEQAGKGDWVQIFKIVLYPEDRAPNIPEETKQVPLTMMVKGFLLNDRAKKGDLVEIKTVTGRVVSGQLAAVNPVYRIDYGRPQLEMLTVGLEARGLLAGGNKNEG